MPTNFQKVCTEKAVKSGKETARISGAIFKSVLCQNPPFLTSKSISYKGMNLGTSSFTIGIALPF
jgi:hypothetical protein